MNNDELFALVKRVDPQTMRLPPGLIAIAAEIEAVERGRCRELLLNAAETIRCGSESAFDKLTEIKQ